MKITWLRKNRLLAIVVMSLMLTGRCSATFDFASPSSKLVLGDFNGGVTAVAGYFKTNAMSGIIGWDQQSIIRGTSQANTISNAWTVTLGVGTIGSTGGSRFSRDLIVTTSDAAVGGGGTSVLLRTTSNAVNSSGTLVRTTSNAMNSTGGLPNTLRTTSNFVNAQWSTLRTTSNWVNTQFVGFGASNLGTQLRGTSNWANSQATEFNSPALGRMLRGTSNWVNNQRVALDSAGLALAVQTAQTSANAAGAAAAEARAAALQAQNQLVPVIVSTQESKESGTGILASIANSATQLSTASKLLVGTNSANPLITTTNGGSSWQNGSGNTVVPSFDSGFGETRGISKGRRTKVTMNSNGGYIHFGSIGNDILQVQNNVDLIFENVTLLNFRDDAIKIGKNSIITFGNETIVKTASDEKLDRDWVCQGNVVINGQNSTLNLNDYQLSVMPGGVLTLENLTLDGARDGTLTCEAIGRHDGRIPAALPDAVLRLRNVRLNFGDLYTFAQGALIVERDVVLSGRGGLAYSSDQQMVIAANSTLKVENGITFAYAPPTDNRDLIVFEDATSQLFLNGCHFVSTTTGARLTRGTLMIDSNNNLHNDGAKALSEGIVFGDGVAADDLHIEYMPGASLNVVSGILTYENVDA